MPHAQPMTKSRLVDEVQLQRLKSEKLRRFLTSKEDELRVLQRTQMRISHEQRRGKLMAASLLSLHHHEHRQLRSCFTALICHSVEQATQECHSKVVDSRLIAKDLQH